MFAAASLRVALALGDQELEQRLRPELDVAEGLAVVAQCLAADHLLQIVESRQVDGVVLAWGLHRLTDSVLEQIERAGLAVVLLAPDPDDTRWHARSMHVVGTDVEAARIQQLLVTSRRGERILHRPRPASEPLRLKSADRADQTVSSRASTIVAVTGGPGSPGRTTVALNLAAALGVGAATALIELDLCSPALAVYLDRDPTRNLCTLAHTVREDPQAWPSALADDLQLLTDHTGRVGVLCGPPKREMRTSIAPAFVEHLIGELAQRYRYVVLDVGPDLLGMDSAAANHRAALASAHKVLVVAGSNLVGLWHARTALDHLERQLGLERQAMSLVLNRHDPRHHHTRSEIEWHLGAPVAAVIPADAAATERAITEQRPLVADSRSRAGRALVELAECLHAGRLRLPAEVSANRNRSAWWGRLWPSGQSAPGRRLKPDPQPLRAAAASRAGRRHFR